MKLLSCHDILKEVESEKIVINGFNQNNLKPASYVLRLDNKWRIWKKSKNPIDLFQEKNTSDYLSDIFIKSEFLIENGEFCLAATQELIRLPNNVAAFISPLSHIARHGLNINLGSSFVSPGFGEKAPTALTLEITSHCPSPILLRYGCPIIHLIFVHVSESTDANYRVRSVFEGVRAPSKPAIWKEWKLNN